tara:strand:+ start:131 stop:247 length:117 start_codon:yes stop_codon:yes gene_type:complete
MKNQEICAEGKDVIVCYDFQKNETFSIPPELREIIAKF